MHIIYLQTLNLTNIFHHYEGLQTSLTINTARKVFVLSFQLGSSGAVTVYKQIRLFFFFFFFLAKQRQTMQAAFNANYNSGREIYSWKGKRVQENRILK